MSPKQQIKAEMSKFEAADELVLTAFALLGAIKATERRIPRVVLATLPKFEAAIERWTELCESEAPNSVEP